MAYLYLEYCRNTSIFQTPDDFIEERAREAAQMLGSLNSEAGRIRGSPPPSPDPGVANRPSLPSSQNKRETCMLCLN